MSNENGVYGAFSTAKAIVGTIVYDINGVITSQGVHLRLPDAGEFQGGLPSSLVTDSNPQEFTATLIVDGLFTDTTHRSMVADAVIGYVAPATGPQTVSIVITDPRTQEVLFTTSGFIPVTVNSFMIDSEGVSSMSLTATAPVAAPVA